MATQDDVDLRKELIGVYSSYLKDPTDAVLKRRARVLHSLHGNTGPGVDKITRHAVNLLVEIGWDLPAPAKPSREVAEKLILALATGLPR